MAIIGRLISTTILAILVILILGFAVTPVFAGIPTVINVVVSSDGGNTVLDVTVSHSPQTSLHHVDSVEVNVSGSIQNFPVSFRPETNFTVSCNLGPIEGTPTAAVRAHCNVDGYSPSYGPITVPEFPHSIMLPLLLLALLTAVIVARKSRMKSNN